MGVHADTTVKTDARDRARRTMLTGLGLDLAVAAGVALSSWITDADLSNPAVWATLGTLVAKSLIQAVASYLVRLKVAPALAPDSTEPAADPGELAQQ